MSDRFSALLQGGRFIASASSPAAVIQAVEEVVSDLMQPDRCSVLEIGPDLRPERRPDLTSAQAAAVDRAVAGRRVVAQAALAGNSPDPARTPPDQVETPPDRTGNPPEGPVMCAPILADDRVVACLLVGYDDPFRSLTDDDAEVANVVATLAGAAMEGLARSEAYFRTLIENSHEITVVTDLDGRPTYVSPSVRRILGRRPEDLLGGLDDDLIHPADIEHFADLWTMATDVDPGRPRRAALRVLHGDGMWRWMEMTLSSRMSDPTVRGMVVNLRDITERRQAEQEMSRLTGQFRLAFELAPIGMALIDLTVGRPGRILRSNGALAAMLGRRPSDLVGTTLDEITFPGDRLRAPRERWATDLLDGHADTWAGETRLQHGDGRFIWVDLHAGVVRDEGGSPVLAIAQVKDITDQRATEARLVHDALHDPLTGLPNRRLLMDRLEHALSQAERRNTTLAVLFLDLDHFKVVNDSFGHSAGDEVLVEVGRRLLALSRASDTLARLGGDEFVLLAEDVQGREEAVCIAERIEASLRGPIELSAEATVEVTASVGVTVAGPGDTPASLLRDADTALYRAKDGGRNRHELFGDQLRFESIHRMRIENELRNAIEVDRVDVIYDPVVDLHSGRAAGAEARALVSDHEGRAFTPEAVMEVAEESRLSAPLGLLVLRSACEELAAWQREAADGRLRMSINVARSQLLSGHLRADIQAAASASGLEPSALAIELREAGLSGPLEPLGRVLGELRDIGCFVGIDDFGSGYASLAYLRRLPLDYLKIGAGFVRGMEIDPDDKAIVAAVVKLADSLSLITVAEGVDTPEEAERLRSLGCRYGQGRLFGRPRAAREAAWRRSSALRGRDSNPQPSG